MSNNYSEWFNQGVLLQNAGDSIGAITCFQRASTINPGVAESYYNLGMALQSVGRHDEAAASYQRAAQVNPGFAEAFNNLGNIHLAQNQFEAAQSAYEKALATKPDLVQANFNLGLSLKKQDQLERAVFHFRKAWELAPDYEEAWENLYVCLSLLKRSEQALDVFLEFEKRAAPSLTLMLYGLRCCRQLGDPAREKRYLDMLESWKFETQDSVTISELLDVVRYFDVDSSIISNLRQTYNRLVQQQLPSRGPLLPPRRTKGAKTRVGYLSPDLRKHALESLILEVLARHDAERFEIYTYSLAAAAPGDETTERIRAASHRFAILAGLGDQIAARRIAEDDLDLLVDLGAEIVYSRPLISACKPARLQLSYLGDHGAVDLDSIDYILTDAYADVPDNDACLAEKLLVMKGCAFPFRRVQAAEPHGYSRAKLGLEGKTVFGVFVSALDLSPRCLQTWRNVLERIGNGVLAFSPEDIADQAGIMRQVSAAGIDSARVAFIPHDSDESVNRARYSLIDIVLDTFPHSGADTTQAALDMAVPVVTLCGRRHDERSSYSILANLGVTETVAHGEAEYADIACRLAEVSEFRQTIQRKIEDGLKSSGLADLDRYVLHLEQAYTQAIEQKNGSRGLGGKLTAEELKNIFQRALRDHQAGETERAEALYLELLEDQPEYAPACHLYGSLLAAQGKNEQALAWLEKAVGQGFQESLAAIGNLQLELGHYGAALGALQRMLRDNPRAHAALNDSGLALMNLGRLDEAFDALRAATALKPDNPTYQFNLGVVCQKRRMVQDAANAYSRALAMQPDFVDAQFNLGVIFNDANQPDRALVCYRQVLTHRPDFERAYLKIGETLFTAGRINAWLENFRRYEQAIPDSFNLALVGIEACLYAGEPEKSERYLRGLLINKYRINDPSVLVDGLERLLYLMLFFDVDQGQAFELYEVYNQVMRKLYPERVSLPESRKPGKLRIGYLSADLRDHVMGKMVYEVISRHDLEQFEIYCCSLAQHEDAWTRKFQAASHKFVRLYGLNENAAAARVAEDELDILVDLSTHTVGAMPGILALKPARVQITHVASAGALGLDAVDFKLTDRYADVPDSQNYLIETLLPMEGCVYPFRRMAPAEAHGYTRELLGLPKDAFVIGAFFTLMKLSPRCLAVWRNVLERIPNAVLAFSLLKPEAKEAYLRRLKAAQIDASRVVFIPAADNEAMNLARYSVVDIVLDPFPYNGVNGTLEALEMGVPVVAMVGKHHSERTTFSMLTNLGVVDTLAQTSGEYIEISHRLATDKSFHRRTVEAIRKGMADSRLVNMTEHVANLENTFRQALKLKLPALYEK